MKKASLYFHINNGGVTLSIEDNGEGPCLVLKAQHFGHLTGRVSVNIKQEALPKVAEMFTDASAMDYSPASPNAADLPRREDSSGMVKEASLTGALKRLAENAQPAWENVEALPKETLPAAT